MSEFFENNSFVTKLNKFTEYKKDKVLEIMKEIKEEQATLSIDIFNCILDKLYEPSVSYAKYTSHMYMNAVDLWNNYVFNSKKNYNLLIDPEYVIY